MCGFFVFKLGVGVLILSCLRCLVFVCRCIVFGRFMCDFSLGLSVPLGVFPNIPSGLGVCLWGYWASFDLGGDRAWTSFVHCLSCCQ